MLDISHRALESFHYLFVSTMHNWKTPILEGIWIFTRHFWALTWKCLYLFSRNVIRVQSRDILSVLWIIMKSLGFLALSIEVWGKVQRFWIHSFILFIIQCLMESASWSCSLHSEDYLTSARISPNSMDFNEIL